MKPIEPEETEPENKYNCYFYNKFNGKYFCSGYCIPPELVCHKCAHYRPQTKESANETPTK